ncbi:hypothetical protein H4R24_004253 [Coemansia sp. RSA 988]|nr:hypothetical protein H4R24_004253 [Coemansia sp. RSA 988]
MAPKHFARVWKHFERHEPTGRAKHHRAVCMYCSYELSGQPERMKTHLSRCPSCPQQIKDEYSTENATSPSTVAASKENNSTDNTSIVGTTTMPTDAMTYTKRTYADSDSPQPATLIAPGRHMEQPQKRKRPIEDLSGAEGLAGLPWAPTANANVMMDSSAIAPPGFQQMYSLPDVTTSIPRQPSTAPTTRTSQMSNASGLHLPSADSTSGSCESSFIGVYDNVRGYYTRLSPLNKMQTSIGPTISPHPLIREAIANVPKAVRDRFYGCGVPLPTGIEGLRVLDLGCGAGRDCYVAAKLVGLQGEVIGVDMTDEQLRVAREYITEYSHTLGYQPHLRFLKGYIEFLSQLPELYPGSIDLCISNNAVNLSPNKELVLRSVFEILKEGGEFQFCDIYADRRLPNHVRSHPVLMGECLGGALYTEDFKMLCQRVGFVDARQVNPPAPVRIESPELRDLVGATQFYSITFRLFKFSRASQILEPTREDYGQVAIYRGTIGGQRARTRFDNQWAFEANRPVLVDGNTAVMLGESWLGRHFEVRGDRSQHFGMFAADPPEVLYEPWETDHEFEEYEIDSGGARMNSMGQYEPVVRRRGILPLPTPYLFNGMRQQQLLQQMQEIGIGFDDRSDPESRRGSPVRDTLQSPPPSHQNNAAPSRSSWRGQQASFPRLSSFSISQSNVRAEGTSGVTSSKHALLSASSTSSQRRQQNLKPHDQPDRRFVLPIDRVAGVTSRQQRILPSMPPLQLGGSNSTSSTGTSIDSIGAFEPHTARLSPHDSVDSPATEAFPLPPLVDSSNQKLPPLQRQHSQLEISSAFPTAPPTAVPRQSFSPSPQLEHLNCHSAVTMRASAATMLEG